MKKYLAILLAVLMTASLLSGCGQKSGGNESGENTEPAPTETSEEGESLPYTPNLSQAKVNKPMSEMPCYALKEGASVEEMREMAVKAMNDELSIKWTPNAYFSYDKTVGLTDRDYIFFAEGVYAGLPYTSSASGLFQWYEHYDPSNGVIYGLDDNIEGKLGNSCAASVSWGLAAVCPSVDSAATFYFVPSRGSVPLGDYAYPEGLQSIKDCTTDVMVKDSGPEKMYECYALLQKADAVIAVGENTAEHAMMVIENAVVTKNADGSINPAESFVMVSDQAAAEFIVEEDGQKVSYRGHTSKKTTFEELLRYNYIPMTTVEFAENRPYEKATVTATLEPTNVKELAKVDIESNYRIAVLRVKILNEKGKTVYEKKYLTASADVTTRRTHSFRLKDLIVESSINRELIEGETYTGRVEVVTATGETFVPVDFTFTK